MTPKYGNTPIRHSGRYFSSKGEAGLFDYLTALEQNGEIREIECQVQVLLSRARIVYKPDFRAISTKTSSPVYFEYKGFETPEWRLKRRLWIAYGPGPLRVYKGYGTGLKMTEELLGEGA